MKTKVLILEDNPVVKKFYEKAVANLSFVDLVGIAGNGEEGLKLLHEKDPDVILCDLNMPIMDGFEFTKRAMAEKPKPILIVSDLVQAEDEANRYKVLELGAIDVLPKPKAGGNLEWLTGDLERKINILKRVVVFTRKSSSPPPNQQQQHSLVNTDIESPINKRINNNSKNFRILAMGASTGGPQAYQEIFSRLNENFSLPIVCAQHISEGFTNSLVSWLSNTSTLKIVLPRDGADLLPGEIYFAPDGYHILVESGRIRLDKEKGEHRHQPSVDYLFESVKNSYGSGTLAVLLTGMGEDGAEGLHNIYTSGGYAIAQDEDSSIVYGMPRAAKEKGVNVILSLQEIPTRLNILAGVKK